MSDDEYLEKHTSELRKNGYTLLPGILDKDTCRHYINLLEHHHQSYAKNHLMDKSDSILANKVFEKVVYNLHNKSLDWYKLFEHKTILSIIKPELVSGSYNNNEPFYLYNNTARNPLKSIQGQQMHIDSNLPGVNYALIVNDMWYLEDSDESNGATILIPGSHTRREYAENGTTYPDQISLPASRGDVLLFNGNIWHGGGANFSGESRWALVLGYARWFIKPSFDYARNTPPHIFSALTDEQKRLLGFDLIPPIDEFTRIRRRSTTPEKPADYRLPQTDRSEN